MNVFARFQALQRLLVESGFSTHFDARREGNEAVLSLTADLGDQNPELMAQLAEITTEREFSFTVHDDKAAFVLQSE